MEKTRKIVLILGNGFDLDLGLKTSYKDFWESEFCPKNYPAPIIHHLNQCWPDNLEAVKWYDLENELLNYYKSIPDPSKGEDIITEEEKEFLKEFSAYGQACGWYKDKQDLIRSLIEKGVFFYNGNPLLQVHELYKEDALESPIWRDRKAVSLIKEGLCKYLNTVGGPNMESVAFHVLLALTKSKQEDSVDIFTFNYTPVLLRGEELKGVHHMHGRCKEGKIIIGTRDDLNVKDEYDFLLKAMDDSFNPPDIVNALIEADEVIIFGHSLGENDRQYFAPFFLHQADYDNPHKKKITVFTRDDNSKIEIKRSLQKMTEGKLSALFSINQPHFIRTANMKEDKAVFYQFLIDHQTDKCFADEVIGKL